MLLLNVGVETVWHRVEIFLPQAAYEAITLHVCLYVVELVSKLAERVDNQT